MKRSNSEKETMCVEFDGYRAHIAVEMQEDIPAHVQTRIVEVRDFFREQFNKGVRRVEQHACDLCEMFAAALREDAHRELISIEGSRACRQARVQEELVGSCGQEAAVARCRLLAAAALDYARAHAENRCERLEERFVRERDRVAVVGSNDCWTQYKFLRVSMKSLLWLWLLREIVAENANEECETVFCTTDIKVPYLNESCMSLSGMSSGPHGQNACPSARVQFCQHEQ